MADLEYQSGKDYEAERSSPLDILLGPDRRKVWRRFTREVGGHYSESGLLAKPKLEAPIESWVMRLDRSTWRHGRSGRHDLRFRVQYPDRDGFRFSVYQAGIQYIPHVAIGHPGLDRELALLANSPEKAQKLFGSADVQGALLECLGERWRPVNLLLKARNRRFASPRGTAELFFRISGVGRHIEELRAIFRLAGAVMRGLREIGSAGAGSV